MVRGPSTGHLTMTHRSEPRRVQEFLLAYVYMYAYNSFSDFCFLSPKISMRKLSLLLGALGGAMAGYVFSNTKLREELADAKDAEAAGKILAKHLQKDGKQIGKEVQSLVKSDAVQDNVKKAKEYANEQFKKVKGDLQGMMNKTAKKATTSAKSATKKAAKKVVKKVEKMA